MKQLTHEERLAMMKAHNDAILNAPPPPRRENKTSLCYWLPNITGLLIPVPRTFILPVDVEAIMPVFDGKPIPSGFMEPVYKAAESMGYPLFLRTDLQSGKHGWKNTCYVPDASVLERNMLGVIEENLMGACSFGPMFEALVFRQFLELDTSFIAFYGDMPVNKERRYFVKDGAIVCSHPYWPLEVIKGHTADKNWKRKLAKLNRDSQEDAALLHDYAVRVAKALPGYWSVDFAKAKSGVWYLIDMALGGESYHWPGCKKVNP